MDNLDGMPLSKMLVFILAGAKFSAFLQNLCIRKAVCQNHVVVANMHLLVMHNAGVKKEG